VIIYKTAALLKKTTVRHATVTASRLHSSVGS